jgi:hypothetical protein
LKRFLIILLAILGCSDVAVAMSVKGKITQNGGAAVKALIVFSSDGVEKASAITGDDGLYYIPDIPEGTYSVKITYRQITREHSGIVIPGGKYDFNL